MRRAGPCLRQEPRALVKHWRNGLVPRPENGFQPSWGRGASCVRTLCPGINVYKHLPAIRQQAAALIPDIRDFHLMSILERDA